MYHLLIFAFSISYFYHHLNVVKGFDSSVAVLFVFINNGLLGWSCYFEFHSVNRNNEAPCLGFGGLNGLLAI